MSHCDVLGTIVDIGINTTQFKVLVEFVVKSQIVLCALFLRPVRWLVHIVACLGMELSGNDRCDYQGIDALCLLPSAPRLQSLAAASSVWFSVFAKA